MEYMEYFEAIAKANNDWFAFVPRWPKGHPKGGKFCDPNEASKEEYFDALNRGAVGFREKMQTLSEERREALRSRFMAFLDKQNLRLNGIKVEVQPGKSFLPPPPKPAKQPKNETKTPYESSKHEVLRKSPTTSSVKLGGGVSGTYKVKLTDGGNVVDKPIKELVYWNSISPFAIDWRRKGATFEVAAYNISESLGFDVVPVTVAVVSNKGPAVRKEFIEGETAAVAGFGDEWGGQFFSEHKEEIMAVALVDYIVGQHDGHRGNYMLRAGTQKVQGVDYNLAGSNRPSSMNLRTLKNLGGWTPEFVAKVKMKNPNLVFDSYVPQQMADIFRARLANWLEKGGKVL